MSLCSIIRVKSPPSLVIGKIECSVHLYSSPWGSVPIFYGKQCTSLADQTVPDLGSTGIHSHLIAESFKWPSQEIIWTSLSDDGETRAHMYSFRKAPSLNEFITFFSQILNLRIFSRNFMFRFLEGCKVSFSVILAILILTAVFFWNWCNANPD